MKDFKNYISESFTSGTLGTYLAVQFAAHIKKKFIEWDAYKLGLIDEKGEILKKAKTPEERKALGTFESLARKIKRVLVKYIGDNKMINFLIAAYLIKKESYEPIVEELEEELSSNELELMDKLLYVLEEVNHEKL